MITAGSIEGLRQRVNLLEVAERYTSLKRAGSAWKGLSPFGAERTPSFFVHPDRGFWKCFSSGKGGDVFALVGQMEGLDFRESAELLAERYGMELEYEQGGGPSKEERSLRKRILEVNDWVATWMSERLAANRLMRGYWTEKRGFELSTAEAWRVGYAPASPSAMSSALVGAGFDEGLLRQSGLFYERGRDLHPRFRGRLMFPVCDVQGRVVAFSGRTVPGMEVADDPAREAKYLNSPEGPVWSKGSHLYGLDGARGLMGEDGVLYLVEGQLDVIRCQEAGLAAVAPLGSALTDVQAGLLSRYRPRAVRVLPDGDKSGRASGARAVGVLWARGVRSYVGELGEGEDPDGLLRGGAGLEGVRWRSGASWVWRVGGGDRAGRESVYEKLSGCLDAVLVDQELCELAGCEGVPVEAVRSAYKVFDARRGRRGDGVPVVSLDGGDEAAEELLRVLVLSPGWCSVVLGWVDLDLICRESLAGRMLVRYLASVAEGVIDPERVADAGEVLVETEEEGAYLAGLVCSDLSEVTEREVEGLAFAVAWTGMRVRQRAIDEALKGVERGSDEEGRLLRERMGLRIGGRYG